MAYEVVMPYHLHMPSYFLGTFTEYPYLNAKEKVCAAYILYTILNASWFPPFRALTKAWASSCEYFRNILIILNIKIKTYHLKPLFSNILILSDIA